PRSYRRNHLGLGRRGLFAGTSAINHRREAEVAEKFDAFPCGTLCYPVPPVVKVLIFLGARRPDGSFHSNSFRNLSSWSFTSETSFFNSATSSSNRAMRSASAGLRPTGAP